MRDASSFWGSAADIFRANMILGGGPGSWPALRAASAISDASYAVLYTPHSSLAVLAVELGLAGLVAGTWLVIGIGRMAWRSIGAAPNADERFQRMLVAGSLLAVGVHSLVDPMWHIPAVVLLTLMLVARLDPPPDADPDPAKSGSTARRRPVVALAVVLAGAAVMVPIDVGMVAGQLGADRLTAGDPEAARDAYSPRSCWTIERLTASVTPSPCRRSATTRRRFPLSSARRMTSRTRSSTRRLHHSRTREVIPILP